MASELDRLLARSAKLKEQITHHKARREWKEVYPLEAELKQLAGRVAELALEASLEEYGDGICPDCLNGVDGCYCESNLVEVCRSCGGEEECTVNCRARRVWL